MTSSARSARLALLTSEWAQRADTPRSQDSEKNTILCLLAAVKANPLAPPNHLASDDAELQRSAIRMARLYWHRFPFMTDWSNQQGRTALHIAALHGRDEFVQVYPTHMPVIPELTPPFRCYATLGQMLTSKIPLEMLLCTSKPDACGFTLILSHTSASAYGHIPVSRSILWVHMQC
jgi:hypothetical protein